MMNKLSSVLLILSLSGFLPAQDRDLPEVVTKVATASANWLKIETGTRAIGLGGAYVAFGEGITAIPYNPSAIAYLQGSQSYYAKTNYLAGITHNVIAYGTRLSGADYIGLHLFYLDSGPMEVTNEWYPNGTGEDFRVVSMAFRTTYARRLTDRLKVGLSINYIRDQIYTTLMQTLAFDIGSNFNTGIYGFVLGMSIANFGPEVQYHGEGLTQAVPNDYDVDERLSKITEKFPLPLVFRLGIKNDLVGSQSVFFPNGTHRVSLAVDGVNPIDYTVYGNVGCEYAFREMAFVRVGSHLGHDTAGLATGAGIRLTTAALVITVDYAFVNYGILNFTHQVSIGLDF